MSKKTSSQVKIWAEGLVEFVTLKVAMERSEEVPIFESMESVDDLPPPLPPIPTDGEEFAEIHEPEQVVSSEEKAAPEDIKGVNHKSKVIAGLVVGFIFMGLILTQWAKGREEFSFNRPARMNPELSEKINKEFKFESWSKNIFFREFVPADMSHIWLVTAGFQNCEVEANFHSVKGKLLAVNDEKIAFKSSSHLKNHLVEFSQFEFSSGNKIVPGLYEMDLKATDCSWDGLAPKVGNLFKSPPSEYVTRMKIVLYHKGNVEFNNVLDKLIRRKLDLEIKNQNQEDLFWQDLQQKLQTLVAISLQIEQLLLEFVEQPATNFKTNLKMTVDKYTKRFGGTLTEFVVQNEKYFLTLENSELSNMESKRSYEKTIRLTSKSIGLESMKIIEELQGMNKPKKEDLKKMEEKIIKQFQPLKDNLNLRIIQLTEDRSGN